MVLPLIYLIIFLIQWGNVPKVAMSKPVCTTKLSVPISNYFVDVRL